MIFFGPFWSINQHPLSLYEKKRGFVFHILCFTEERKKRPHKKTQLNSTFYSWDFTKRSVC